MIDEDAVQKFASIVKENLHQEFVVALEALQKFDAEYFANNQYMDDYEIEKIHAVLEAYEKIKSRLQ